MRNTSKVEGGQVPASRIGSQFDNLENSINSTFLRNISSNLFPREVSLMLKSYQFLERLENQKDIETTIDSEPLFKERQSSKQKRKKLERSRKHLYRNRTVEVAKQIPASIVLKEVQEKCSQNIVDSIKRMIEEFQNMKMFFTNRNMKREKIKREEGLVQKLQQENIILTKTISKYRQQIFNLKKQLLSQQQSHESISFAGLRQAKEYLNQKELLIDQKMEKIRKIEQNIENALLFKSEKDQCQNCCSMLKRLKDVIMKYRGLLREEGMEIDDLYKKYKNQIFRHQLPLNA